MSLSNPDLPTAWLTDPRVRKAGAAAFGVHVRATILCWVNDYDGLLPKDALGFCGRDAGQQRTLNRLTKSGLWEDQGEHFYLVDYLEHQLSGLRRDQIRRDARDRKAKERGQK